MSLSLFPALCRREVTAWRLRTWLVPLCAALCLTTSCRPDDDGEEEDDDEEEEVAPLPKRAGTLVIDGCGVHTDQQATLRSASTRQVVSDLLLVCLSLTDRGGVSLRSAQTKLGLRTQIADLRSIGYVVHLGITAVDEDDDDQPAAELTRWLRRPLWRQGTVQALTEYAQDSDGLHVLLPELENQARGDLTTWVTALAAKVRPKRPLGLFVPPSLKQPSEIPGGDAYDLTALVGQVDRVHVLTLDASSGETPGPMLDADWTLQVAASARSLVPDNKLNVSVPLGGIDFQMVSTPARQIADETPVTFAEALALASMYSVTPQGEEDEARHFAYKDASNNEHEVWFEDSASIVQGLRDLPEASLPVSVGVVYFDLGREDPTLFATLAQAASEPQGAAARPSTRRTKTRGSPSRRGR